jgi:uncharacterized protein
MREGAQAIYQAHLQHDRWVGRADFLMRVDSPSASGGFGYEAVDTKLAVETRAGTILQLCLYSELISLIQGSKPVHMRVVTPVERIDYRVADYEAYYRLARKSLVSRLEQATESYPEPVDHCDVCRWWSRCDKRRHDDDHLSLVAGISRSQRADLVEHELRSLQAFAEAQPIKPRRGSRQSLERVQKQAQVQLRGRLMKTVLHELASESDRGARGRACRGCSTVAEGDRARGSVAA